MLAANTNQLPSADFAEFNLTASGIFALFCGCEILSFLARKRQKSPRHAIRTELFVCFGE
jgi:hypothetical protein